MLPIPELRLARGEMADRVRAFDWAATALGPMDSWPPALRLAVGMCLASRFPMFVWWGPQYINIYNDAYVPMLGHRHPGALGRPARDSWDDIWDIVGTQADHVTRTGEATWNERVKLVMHRHGYEEETWFTWSYSPIFDEAGNIGGMFCAVTEETGRVLAEAERDALLERADSERARLAETFAQSPSFLAVLRGPEHVFEFANARYLQLVGRRDVVGRPLREALPEVVDQGFADILDRVYASGEPHVGHAAAVSLRRTPDEPPELMYLDYVYQPMRDSEGQVTGILVHGVDMTARHHESVERARVQEALAASLDAEQHARSEAEAASRMKDEFLASLSHELRTPLNAILGWSHMLRQEGLAPEKVAHGADVIDRNARAQMRIIQDLLDMSAIVAGKIRLEAQRVDLREIIRAALETARPAAEKKGVAIELGFAEDTSAAVTGDPNRLQQVFWNLFSNAVKFTPPGGHVRVSLERDHGDVVVSMTDTGEGISPAFLPHVFERFRQADGTIARRHGGLGLGLAIVRQLVELQGGQVQAHSGGLGHGATFTVRLPAAGVGGEEGGQREQQTRAAIAGRRVLVVDDDRDAREMVQRLLEECDATVRTAANSAEAFGLLQQERFDLLVSDIGMPGEDGYALIRRVRGMAPAQGGDIPALALTAYARPEDRAQALLAGFQRHATKPVDPRELLALVGSLASRTTRR